MRLVKPSPELFDGQAEAFDRRAGLPSSLCRAIAERLFAIGEVPPAGVIVEVGAGTGQIGAWLAASRRYVGFDLSADMSRRFRARAGASPRGLIVRADANATWPIASGVAHVVFGSRALHLLEHEHAADEIFRVSRVSGATLVLGRVERPQTSPRARLAHEMRARLTHLGFEPRDDEQHRLVLDACVARGARPLDCVTVASWTSPTPVRASLDNWRVRPAIAGVQVPASVRRVLVDELEAWAASTFGPLDRPGEYEEAYVLRPLRIGRTP